MGSCFPKMKKREKPEAKGVGTNRGEKMNKSEEQEIELERSNRGEKSNRIHKS